MDKTYIVRFSWATALFILFAAWAMLSTAWAGNRFAALVQSFHLVSAAALFWAMAQLVRSWIRLRLVAGLCTGLLLVYIAHSLHYKFVDVPDTARYWREHRAEEMAARGWKEGDFALRQYEQKVLGGEMIGFHASPNTFAATLVLLGVVVAGVGIQRLVNRDESGLIGATLLILPAAIWIIWMTHSNTALLTPLIAAGILGVIAIFGGALARQRRLAFAAGVLAVVLGAIALIGHGIFHDSLPGASLNFRWRYWTAAMDIFAARPFAGVGYGNFGYWYLGARLPAAAEEIKDPHNLVVRAMSELGAIGAILLLAWIGRVWWEWTNPTLPAGSAQTAATKRGQPYGPQSLILSITALAVLGIATKVFAGIDLVAPPDWVLFELLKHIVYGALLMIGYALASLISTTNPVMDDRPAPWVLYGMLAALGVFLIHNVIDFSLFEIGPMMLFATIGGAVLGVRSPSAAGQRKRTSLAVVSLGALTTGWLAGLIFVAVPLIDAENRAHYGDEAYRRAEYRAASEHYTAAFMNAPVKNADYALRAHRSLNAVSGADGLARAALANAIDANPMDPMGYLARARYNRARHPDQREEIRKDYEKALALNPHDIDSRIEYATLLESFDDQNAAIEQYKAALKTNEGFDPTEPKRLPADRVREIEEKISG